MRARPDNQQQPSTWADTSRRIRMAAARRVLSMYRKLLRTGRAWNIVDERPYITSETQRLFRENSHLTNPADIERKLFEAQSRLDLANFYGMAAPRYFYNQPGHVHKCANKTAPEVRPAYLDSDYELHEVPAAEPRKKQRRQKTRIDRSRNRVPIH